MISLATATRNAKIAHTNIRVIPRASSNGLLRDEAIVSARRYRRLVSRFPVPAGRPFASFVLFVLGS